MGWMVESNARTGWGHTENLAGEFGRCLRTGKEGRDVYVHDARCVTSGWERYGPRIVLTGRVDF